MRQDWYIGYCRASTEEQARDGATLAAQPYALRAWAEQRGVEIRLLFERGCSGKRGSKRPKPRSTRRTGQRALSSTGWTG
jgi:DNA invertase Pin-like site-specific DNA recombinase